jgi:hypothetical protein
LKKIPVKIVEITSPVGKKAKDVMLDVYDYYEITGNVQEKIHGFKENYFAIVKKAINIMPKNKSERKASHFWKIGKLLVDFNRSIKNEFDITNYNQAVIRDFGLYNRSVVGHTLQFGDYFKKEDVSDLVPMSHYMELIWKANMLKDLGLFEKEKKRLLKMAREKKLPPHKEYRVELNKLTENVKGKTRHSI